MLSAANAATKYITIYIKKGEWNNDNGGGIGSGDWKTLETRQWMEELGIRANYCIKDGDQIIY